MSVAAGLLVAVVCAVLGAVTGAGSSVSTARYVAAGAPDAGQFEVASTAVRDNSDDEQQPAVHVGRSTAIAAVPVGGIGVAGMPLPDDAQAGEVEPFDAAGVVAGSGAVRICLLILAVCLFAAAVRVWPRSRGRASGRHPRLASLARTLLARSIAGWAAALATASQPGPVPAPAEPPTPVVAALDLERPPSTARVEPEPVVPDHESTREPGQPVGPRALPRTPASVPQVGADIEPDLPAPSADLPVEDSALRAEIVLGDDLVRVDLADALRPAATPQLTWYVSGDPPSARAAYVYLGRSARGALYVDLAQCPDVLTITGDPRARERIARGLIDQVADGRPLVRVTVVGDPTGCGQNPPWGRYRQLMELTQLDLPGGEDEEPIDLVICAGGSADAGLLSRLRGEFGSRLVPIVVGDLPLGLWSLHVGPIPAEDRAA